MHRVFSSESTLIRVVDLTQSGVTKGKPRYCSTCGQITSHGKKFCVDHVDSNPYVANLMVNLSEREEQDLKVKEKGSRMVKLGSITAQEIINCLEIHGPRTVERMSRDLDVEVAVLQGYVQALQKRGFVSLVKKRRSFVVHLK